MSNKIKFTLQSISDIERNAFLGVHYFITTVKNRKHKVKVNLQLNSMPL